ncbi:hypothetical protein TL16_g06743 [Triparma laevis f. inornata]|uniref:EamA domain-containing protein n=1 Tax=Triparma laevis f. inornata TaxID=1714386 RepID=A0A9W7ARL2_9STRA|nr:hypothetical protein TL16_g06743 [Triparma laevis f. inornata]
MIPTANSKSPQTQPLHSSIGLDLPSLSSTGDNTSDHSSIGLDLPSSPSSHPLSSTSENTSDNVDRTPWILSICFVALAWGLNFPVTKLVTDSGTNALTIPAGSFTCLRFALSGAALSPFLFLKSTDLKQNLLGGLEVGAYLAIGYVSQAVGLQTETAGSAGFLCSLQVVFVTLLAAARTQKISPKALSSAVLAVLGVAQLEGIGQGGFEGLTPGFLILMLQPIAFGFSYLRIENLMKKSPDDALPFAASQMLATALFAGAYATMFEGGSTLPDSFHAIFADGLASPQALAIGYTALFGTVISVALECEALKYVSPREASVILTSEPLVASVGAAMLLKEQFDGWLGAALIILASVVTFLPDKYLTMFNKGEEDGSS